MTDEKNKTNKPTHEIRLGCVKAAIWSNRSEKGSTLFSVTFSRSYHNGNEWKRSESFRRDDLPLLTTAAEMAFEWIEALIAKEPDTQQTEPGEDEVNM